MTEHKFEPFPGTDATNFIQWKGTQVCMDLHCPCGAHNHIDAEFAYYVKCGNCGAIFELGTQVRATLVAWTNQEPVEGKVFP